MNVSLQRTERTSGPDASATTSSSPAPAGAAPLLPEPGSGGLDGMQSAMSMMYSLVAQQGQLSMSTGQVGVTAQTKQQQVQSQEEANALKQEEADEAKMDTGGSLFNSICHVFSDAASNLEHGRIGDVAVDAVSDVVNTVDSPHLLAQLEAVAPQVAEYVGVAAAVVGAAAFTAASCGTGGIVVAAVVIGLSAGGMFASKTQCFGKDSAYIGLGMDVASAVVTFGASSAMLADGALQTASAVADGASGASDVLAGASTIVVGHQQANVLDDTADVQQVTQAMARSQRLVADLVTGLKSAQQSNKDALQVLAGATSTYNQTLTLASAGKA